MNELTIDTSVLVDVMREAGLTRGQLAALSDVCTRDL